MAQTGRTRQDFVPADAILIQPDNVNAEVYFYDDTNGRPCARVFKGRRIEPTLFCYYPSTASRDQSIKLEQTRLLSRALGLSLSRYCKHERSAGIYVSI